MNYFAHGRLFVDRPYFLAGTAVPDWLNVINRRIKARSKNAQLVLEGAADNRVTEVAQGVVQHHQDDRWFHETRAFTECSMQLSLQIRELLSSDAGFRSGFLGHILVELLLDAHLIAGSPGLLDEYYESLASVDPAVVASAVGQIARQDVPQVADLLPRFVKEYFLADYADDTRLLYRLNQVMRRVGLPQLPEQFCDLLPEARELVRANSKQLLPR